MTFELSWIGEAEEGFLDSLMVGVEGVGMGVESEADEEAMLMSWVSGR